MRSRMKNQPKKSPSWWTKRFRWDLGWKTSPKKVLLDELKDFDEIWDEKPAKKVLRELKDFDEIWDEKTAKKSPSWTSGPQVKLAQNPGVDISQKMGNCGLQKSEIATWSIL